jgi:RNA 2',3'-cyclic 3'-phosphodiesterase
MRSFVAIELDATLKQALAQMLRSLERARPPYRLKWVAPELQHITLQFLGEINPSDVRDITQALQLAAMGIASFELTLAEIGCFPNIYKPNVLWVGVREPSGALQKLYTAVGAQLGRIGFPPETRAFTPHLTLARVPREASANDKRMVGEWFVKQAPPEAQTMRVTQVHLTQSELSRAGPRYTALRVVGLTT